MQAFKRKHDAIQAKKSELSEQKVGHIRNAVLSALGDERRAIRLVDEQTGESFHVRVDNQRVKCAPSMTIIIKALQSMEVPTAEDFLARLDGLCAKERKTLKVTKTTRSPSIEPPTAELQHLCLNLRRIKQSREAIRKDIKALQEDFAPSELRMAAALQEAGIEEEEAKDDDGMPFMICLTKKKIRKRVPSSEVAGKVLTAFEAIKSVGRPMTTKEMASIIFNAINPYQDKQCVVIR